MVCYNCSPHIPLTIENIFLVPLFVLAATHFLTTVGIHFLNIQR